MSSSKQSSSDTIHLCQCFFQSSKHFWNALFGIANSSWFDFFYLFNRSQTLCFHRCLQFLEEAIKVNRSQVRWIEWLRHDYGFVFGQKLTRIHRCVCELICYHGTKSMIGFSTILCISDELFRVSPHKFKVARACGKNFWCTKLLQSKKTVSKTFSFERTWVVFF